MSNRTRDYTRKMMFKKAIRKKRLAETHSWNRDFPWYNNLHEYSKNKIHCSCPMCSEKTRNKGRRAKGPIWAKSINYKHSDLVKQLRMDSSEKEFLAA